MLMPRCCACGSIIAWHSDMTSASDTGSSDSDSFPDSITARSRISLISSSRCQPAWRIWSMLSFWDGRRRRGVGLHQLGEAEDRIERAAQLVAHAGEEIRFREVGFLRRGLGALQLDVLLLQRLLEAFELGHVARRGEHALQPPVAVVEGGRVVGHHRLLAVPGARGELVVGDLAFAQHALMPASARSGSVK